MKCIINLQKIGEVDSSIVIRLKKNLHWVFKNFGIKVDINPTVYTLKDDESRLAFFVLDFIQIISVLKKNTI
jgi:hypothetical protein